MTPFVVMFVRALLAFVALPGLAAVLAPPFIAHLDPWRGQTWQPGLAMMCGGALVLLWCVRDFYVSGKGTLAPWDPPKQLVVVGLYRFVRNPMYVGVLLLVLGWSLCLASPCPTGYAALLAVGFHLRVVMHEEPWLDARFGQQWRTYKAVVPRWIPNLRHRNVRG
jgi:protein-S-isoprenylcysteine O-methyltransferase Ste14